jgi:hypothetical protein
VTALPERDGLAPLALSAASATLAVEEAEAVLSGVSVSVTVTLIVNDPSSA